VLRRGVRPHLPDGAPQPGVTVDDAEPRGGQAARHQIVETPFPCWRRFAAAQSALAAVSPDASPQRCWNHRILNLLDKLPKRLQPAGRRFLSAIPYAETREAAERQKRAFQTWGAKKGVTAVGHALDHDWDWLVAFYEFPKAHWTHLRTSNPIESPFAAARLRTAAAKRYKKVANATAVIWKTLLIAERRAGEAEPEHGREEGRRLS